MGGEHSPNMRLHSAIASSILCPLFWECPHPKLKVTPYGGMEVQNSPLTNLFIYGWPTFKTQHNLTLEPFWLLYWVKVWFKVKGEELHLFIACFSFWLLYWVKAWFKVKGEGTTFVHCLFFSAFFFSTLVIYLLLVGFSHLFVNLIIVLLL